MKLGTHRNIILAAFDPAEQQLIQAMRRMTPEQQALQLYIVQEMAQGNHRPLLMDWLGRLRSGRIKGRYIASRDSFFAGRIDRRAVNSR